MFISRLKFHLKKFWGSLKTPYVLLCISVISAIFIFSVWVALFTYEPERSETLFYNPFYVFIVIFLPITSIVISIINIFKLMLDLIMKKPGSQLRFFMTLAFMIIVFIVSFVITFISIGIIKNNMEIWLTKDIDMGLQSIVESFEEKLKTKKMTMTEAIEKLYERNILPNAVGGRYRESTLESMLHSRGITNFSIIYENSDTNYYMFKYGIDPVINLDISERTKTSNFYTESEYENSFYVTALIPITNKNENNIYALWTEEMEKDFVSRRNNSLNVLRLYRSMSLFYADFSMILNLLYIFVIGIACFITIISVSFMSRIITEPVISVSNMAEAITASNFDVHVDTHGAGEIRLLIHRFNIMARSLKHHRDIEEETQKINLWKDVALKLAHEIKNPLTPIIMNAEFIKYLTDKERIKDKEKIDNAIAVILRNAETIQSLVKTFSQFSFETNLSEEKISINEVLKEVVSSFTCGDKIIFHTGYTKIDYKIKMDRQKLMIAFTNMIKNAVEAIEPKETGYIYISTYHEIIENKDYFLISITDTGVGIKNESVASIFEPYYTSKEKGTGLGLSVVEKIISDHGGSIDVVSVEKEGTTFFIKFEVK